MSWGLSDEFTEEVAAMTLEHFAALEAAGVPRSTLWRGASLVGVAGIAVGSGGLYDVFDAGESHFITPVGDRGEGDIGWNAIHDLVAWKLGKPEQVYFRTGSGALLNPESIRRAIHYDEVLHLHANVLNWLRHDAQGAVLLDHRASPGLWLGGVGRVLVDDAALKHRLRRALETQVPEIRIRADGGIHAT